MISSHHHLKQCYYTSLGVIVPAGVYCLLGDVLRVNHWRTLLINTTIRTPPKPDQCVINTENLGSVYSWVRKWVNTCHLSPRGSFTQVRPHIKLGNLGQGVTCVTEFSLEMLRCLHRVASSGDTTPHGITELRDPPVSGRCSRSCDFSLSPLSVTCSRSPTLLCLADVTGNCIHSYLSTVIKLRCS